MNQRNFVRKLGQGAFILPKTEKPRTRAQEKGNAALRHKRVKVSLAPVGKLTEERDA